LLFPASIVAAFHLSHEAHGNQIARLAVCLSLRVPLAAVGSLVGIFPGRLLIDRHYVDSLLLGARSI